MSIKKKLLFGCLLLLLLACMVSACVGFFFGKTIYDRVMPFFGGEPEADISNTLSR